MHCQTGMKNRLFNYCRELLDVIVYVMCDFISPLLLVFHEFIIEIVKFRHSFKQRHELLIGAVFFYFLMIFVDTYTAGIVLTGTEIKSIRLGKASLVDTFCYINNGEIWVKGMNVSPYFYGSYSNHEAKRDRKLLLTKREIHKLQEATKAVGFTIVPTLVFIDDKGRAKMDIALARGKKEFDKRQTLKEKEDRREMDRAIKRF